jgi:DNA damage-inducible protein 1
VFRFTSFRFLGINSPSRRISISIVSSNVTLATDLIPLDVFPDMTFNDIKALVHGELNISPSSQHFYYNNRVITDNSQTLEATNIHEGDMLGMAIQDPTDLARRRLHPESSSSNQTPPRPTQRQREGHDPERIRLHMIGDPHMLEEVRRQDPDLAAAAPNKDEFHALWDTKQRQLAQAQAEKEAELALLNADPFNVEAQAKIEEMIRQERVAENVQKALEDNPESFGRVTMLYISVLVNNVPIKAFVDSGAQTTIMSPSAAQSCGIMRLIDRRFGGIARGVGTAEILGRVHSAEIQIGQYLLPSSFTVMEGKDVDLLLGLDMLKRHQMCIDLKENVLRVQDDKIEFLPENEIPKQLEEHMLEDEPKIEGPGGMKVGARTGTVEQAGEDTPVGTGGAMQEKGKGAQGGGPEARQQGAAASSSSSRPAQPPSASASSGGVSQESIAKITALGFTREEAIHALQQVGGDVEMAVGLLI